MSSQLQSSTYKYNSYASTNGFFILRVPLIINGQLSMIDCSDGILTLNSRYPSLGITFNSLFDDVNAVVKKYGISQISNCWCEDVPLFELQHSTPAGMEEFIGSAEMVQSEIASRISAQFAELQAVSGSSAPRLPVVAHTEVYLLSPDPANKDASLVMVTPQNVFNCLAMQKKREVFNFGVLFRKHRQKSSGSIYGPPTLQLLLEDLNEIVEWYQIGIHLDIPRADLEDIKRESDDVIECRCKMLATWFQRNCKPTWATIITALVTIGRRNLAYKMALKYGVPIPRSMPKSEQAPTPEKKDDPIQQKLTSRVAQLQQDIQSKDMELVVHKQTTTEARNSRDIARGKVNEVGEKAVEVQTKVSLLIEKSCNTQQELERKQSTLRAFQKIPEKEKEEFQGIIDHTSQEIQKYQKELEAIQAELAAEREKAHSLPEQLQQATKELAEKSARVVELEWARQKLETLLEHERKSVNWLLMQATVASDLQQHSKEIKNQLDAAKKELVAKTEEINILKQIIANQDEEVESLRTELRAKEDLLQMLLMQLSQAPIPDPAQQQKLQRLTKEVSELRAKLSDAEDAKQKAERLKEAAELTSSLLREIVRDIRGPPPKPAQKPIQKSTQSKATEAEMASITWEYTVFTKSSAKIIAKLANVKLAGRIADELSAAGIIGQSVRDAATTFGPGVTEDHRIRPIIVALKDKIHQNAQVYHQFRDILLSLGPDAETAYYYMPKKDPRTPVPKPRTKRATKDQGHATEQQKMTLQWRTSRDAPVGMDRGSATTHGKMAYFNSDGSREIYQFDVEGEEWVALPNCPNGWSAMVVTTAGLTTVGGRDDQYRATNSLATLTGWGKDRKWVERYPQMPTSRYNLTAVCKGRSLIAAGGRDDGGRLSTVEVMDMESLKWTHVSSLPHPMSWASIAVRQGKVYLLGGWDQNGFQTLSVFTCSMSELLQIQPLDAQPEKTADQLGVWHQAANAPYYFSTAVSIGDCLLAVGGFAANEWTSAIVSYDDTTNSWQAIGHMITPRERPLVVVLPGYELMVVGGWGGPTKVEIGKIVA